MALPQQPAPITEAAYLEQERSSTTRHEFAGGELYAMTGASWAHNVICQNTAAALSGQLADSPCVVVSSDMRLKIMPTHSYRYPDVMVVCGEPVFLDDRQDTVLNPVVLVEVLSPSTALIDRNDKLREYRQIDSVQMYLLIAQDSPRIEWYTRQDDRGWLYADTAGLGQQVALPAINCLLALAAVYHKVNL